MTQRMIVITTDDIDGSENARTRNFSFEGVDYEIDLTDANFDKFAAAMATWTNKARKAGRRTAARAAVRPGARTPEELAKIRDWARANGHKVSDRGRIAAPIIEAYDAAK